MMIAATGLTNQQRRLDTIANNISNVNTTAYRNSRLEFKDAMYTAGISPGPPRTPDGNLQKGHGLMIAGISKDFSGGSLQVTDRTLDVAITGDGYFALDDGDGNIFYTRNGSFNLGLSGDDYYLVNAEGYFVLDAGGQRIQLSEDGEGLLIDKNGVITTPENQEGIALGIYTFRNVMGLSAEGSGNFAETEASGERVVATDVTIKQGALEGSNVSLANEMTRLIRTQRAFSLVSRALTTADEMQGIANNMRR